MCFHTNNNFKYPLLYEEIKNAVFFINKTFQSFLQETVV